MESARADSTSKWIWEIHTCIHTEVCTLLVQGWIAHQSEHERYIGTYRGLHLTWITDSELHDAKQNTQTPRSLLHKYSITSLNWYGLLWYLPRCNLRFLCQLYAPSELKSILLTLAHTHTYVHTYMHSSTLYTVLPKQSLWHDRREKFGWSHWPHQSYYTPPIPTSKEGLHWRLIGPTCLMYAGENTEAMYM